MKERGGAVTVTLIDRAVARGMRASYDHPRLTLTIVLVLVMLSVLASLRLGIDADSSKMLAPDLPDQQRAHALSAAFPVLKATVLITVSSDQPDTADLAVAELVENLRDDARLKRVFAPAVDPYLSAHGFLYRDLDEVEESLARLNKSANLLARLRSDRTLDGFAAALSEAILLSERAEIGPEALERLFAETAATVEAHSAGRRYTFNWSSVLDDDRVGPVTRLISVLPELDTSRLSPAKPALAAIDGAIADLPSEIAESVDIAVTGEPALRADEMQSVINGIGLSLALSLVLVLMILWLGLGSGARAALGLIALLVSLVLTTGFAALAVGTLNLISVAFIVLMVGLGVDFAIHILAHIAEQRRNGSLPAEAVSLTGHRTGLALALSAVTTALAFLAFSATDFDGMAQLGLIGSGGVLIAFCCAATVIPAIIAMRPGITGAARDMSLATKLPKPGQALPIGVLALGVVALWPASLVRFDADPMALRDPGSSSVQAFLKLAETPETSPYRASILVESAAEADRLASRLDGAPEVGGAINFADLIPEDQEEKLALLDFAAASIDHAVAGQPTALLDDQASEGDRLTGLMDRLGQMDGMSQRLFRALDTYRSTRSPQADQRLEAELFRSFPLMVSRLEAMLTAETVSRSTLPEPLRERFLNDDGLYRVEILPEADLSYSDATRRFVESVAEITPDAAGGPIQLVAAGKTVAEAMLRATLLAGAMTLILTLLATRRMTDAVAILLPLVVAGVLTAAASTLLDMPFNYANVIVLPLMIGIGVDSGIHIALRERRAPGAVFATSTPRAVVVSVLTTIAAFGTLALSDHRGTASMGILLAISIGATMLCVLSLTPALIRWSNRSVGAKN